MLIQACKSIKMGSTPGEVDLENQELVPPVAISRGGCWQIITGLLNLIHSAWQFLMFTKANNHIKSSPADDESEVSFRSCSKILF